MNRSSTRAFFPVVFHLAVVALALGIATVATAQDGRKVALVIGNGNYTNLGRLNNPPNDARDMAAALRTIGFEVDTVIDGNLRQMEQAVVRLSDRLSGSADTTGYFFYAGHGVQSDGSNYLIPAGASIPSEDFLSERALSAQVVLNIMQRAGNDLNVVVLDACRDNPFSWSRSGTRGLSAVTNQPPGSIIAYATSAGSTAQGVMETTDNRQVPAVYKQFFGSAYLAGTSSQTARTPGFTVDRTFGSVRVTVATGGTVYLDGARESSNVTVRNQSTTAVSFNYIERTTRAAGCETKSSSRVARFRWEAGLATTMRSRFTRYALTIST